MHTKALMEHPLILDESRLFRKLFIISVVGHVLFFAFDSIVNMFNPAVIVVGGAVSSAGEVFLAEIRQRVYELSLPLATRDLSIVRSLGDEKEPLRGGAEMVREQLFDATLPRWFADGRPTITDVMAAS